MQFESISKGKLVLVPFFKSGPNLLNNFSKTYTITDKIAGECVYKIFCNGCNLCYVGQTGRDINSRMTEHRYGGSAAFQHGLLAGDSMN